MPTTATATLDAADEAVTLPTNQSPIPITTAAFFLSNTSANTAAWKVQARPRGGSAYIDLGWVNMAGLTIVTAGNFSATNSTDYILTVPGIGWADSVRLYLVSITSGSYAARAYGMTDQEATDMNFPLTIVNSAVATTITSSSATALAVGANGSTNPVFSVNANTASVATGLTVIGAAAAAGVALTVLSSGTNEALNINAKGSGNINMNASGTGVTVFTTGITMADATNIVVNATTGTKIGTATTQKLGFFNATPAVQPVANTDTTTGAAGSVTGVFLNTTFTGGGTAAYTIGGVIKSLKALGLLAA